jgi:hypothetical protein
MHIPFVQVWLLGHIVPVPVQVPQLLVDWIGWPQVTVLGLWQFVVQHPLVVHDCVLVQVVVVTHAVQRLTCWHVWYDCGVVARHCVAPSVHWLLHPGTQVVPDCT